MKQKARGHFTDTAGLSFQMTFICTFLTWIFYQKHWGGRLHGHQTVAGKRREDASPFPLPHIQPIPTHQTAPLSFQTGTVWAEQTKKPVLYSIHVSLRRALDGASWSMAIESAHLQVPSGGAGCEAVHRTTGPTRETQLWRTMRRERSTRDAAFKRTEGHWPLISGTWKNTDSIPFYSVQSVITSLL